MDRHELMLQLGKAERRVTEGNKLLEEQRALIAKMASEGQDITAAKGLLAECERMQQRHVADRDQLRALLAQAR